MDIITYKAGLGVLVIQEECVAIYTEWSRLGLIEKVTLELGDGFS